MKYIKSHKKEFIVLFLAVLVLLFSLISFLIIWFQGSNNKYGDRLEGISDVSLSDSYIKDITKKISDSENITSTNYNLEGRLLSIYIYTKHEASKDDMKKIGDLVISNMKEKELKYYDVQLFISFDNTGITNDEEIISPIVGYKHKTSDVFVWSNN